MDLRQGTSILIPSWNNLPYLKKCIQNLQEWSEFPHEIIVHVNDGSDGTLEWVKEQGLKYSHTPENVGVCVAMNAAYKLATKDLICYFNDDYVALPQWDAELQEFSDMQGLGDDVVLGSAMIQPSEFELCYMPAIDYGTSVEGFREKLLLRDLPKLRPPKGDAMRAASQPPNIIHRKWWDKVGGYSEEFSPGVASDTDLIKKLYDAGMRDFIAVRSSLVYHFVMKSTGRVKPNAGGEQFFIKHGMSERDFFYKVLGRGQKWSPEDSKAVRPDRIVVINRQCALSMISVNKTRPEWFDRKVCFQSLSAGVSVNVNAELHIVYDENRGKIENHFIGALRDTLPIHIIDAGTEAGAFLQTLDYINTLGLRDNDIVYIVEDDYLHRDGWLDILREGIARLDGVANGGFVTLYDHGDKYLPMYNGLHSAIIATQSCHWRSTPSTTNTYAFRYGVLRKTEEAQRKFSTGMSVSNDHGKFLELGQMGFPVISPVPSFSAHLETAYLPPVIDWKKVHESY